MLSEELICWEDARNYEVESVVSSAAGKLRSTIKSPKLK